MRTDDDSLRQARQAYEHLAWGDAYRLMSEAGEQAVLGAEDLERLAVAAYLTGREGDAADALERAHRAWLGAGEVAAAVRCAFWLGVLLMQGGQPAQAGGWFARAASELDAAGLDGPERGYLMVPPALQALMGGENEAALAGFRRAAKVADRFDDPDLLAMSRLGLGQSLVELGDAAAGVARLDEAMVAATSGEVSPILVGIVYCGVIIFCQKVFDVRRAQEWTGVLSRWCDAQQDLQPYRGQCLVHRSELLQLKGDWSAALTEAEQACAHLAGAAGDPVMGMAQYQLGELHRVRGAFDRAEACYRQASRWGHPVQPGLALLRLAQGRIGDAEAAIRRVVEERHGHVRRSRVLAAHAEIMLAVGDLTAAREAAEELAEIAASFDAPFLRAVCAYTRGAVLLAAGEAGDACADLQAAAAAWRAIDAPYEVARAQLLLARACQQLGDRDTAAVDLATARRTFEQLGAAPALAQVSAVAGAGARPAPGGLTPREVEVLKLVARGWSNRQVAEELVISEKTVARHLNNIFVKLGISSRAAATAYSYEHDLV